MEEVHYFYHLRPILAGVLLFVLQGVVYSRSQQCRLELPFCVVHMKCRPVGRGGSRGFARTPLLAPKRFYIHCYSTF